MPKTRAERKKIYREALFNYGFITLCYMIDRFAETEDYEECALIKATIDGVSKELSTDLPTEYGEKAIAYFKESMLTIGGTGKEVDLDKKLPEYTNKVLKQLR